MVGGVVEPGQRDAARIEVGDEGRGVADLGERDDAVERLVAEVPARREVRAPRDREGASLDVVFGRGLVGDVGAPDAVERRRQAGIDLQDVLEAAHARLAGRQRVVAVRVRAPDLDGEAVVEQALLVGEDREPGDVAVEGRLVADRGVADIGAHVAVVPAQAEEGLGDVEDAAGNSRELFQIRVEAQQVIGRVRELSRPQAGARVREEEVVDVDVEAEARERQRGGVGRERPVPLHLAVRRDADRLWVGAGTGLAGEALDRARRLRQGGRVGERHGAGEAGA